jgi:hypothetical protein
MGGHVLRETTSRGLCGLGCPSRTSERGGEGWTLRFILNAVECRAIEPKFEK